MDTKARTASTNDELLKIINELLARVRDLESRVTVLEP